MANLLYATDFSESSQNAFRFVKSMVQKYPMKVNFIHIFDIPIPTTTTLATNAVAGMIKEREDAIRKNLEDLRDELPEANRGEIFAIYGTYPSTEIAEKATETDSMLIVMALRQRYSFLERLIGTTTAHTIQKSSVPVLAIPSGMPFREFESILFPTELTIGEDLHDKELKALKWLQDFVGMVEQPDIHLIHISPDRDRVTTTIKDEPFPGMEFTVTAANSIEEGILNFLDQNSMDLIAIYKPNRSFWERLYHSSTTRKLLEQKKAPLLVFS
ncbi:MAG TPA: universal stress protein [Membranihabitans sp.]|nr:universal stress protein [Membranihabitans sp.]